jgi:hypothetical protein
MAPAVFHQTQTRYGKGFEMADDADRVAVLCDEKSVGELKCSILKIESLKKAS